MPFPWSRKNSINGGERPKNASRRSTGIFSSAEKKKTFPPTDAIMDSTQPVENNGTKAYTNGTDGTTGITSDVPDTNGATNGYHAETNGITNGNTNGVSSGRTYHGGTVPSTNGVSGHVAPNAHEEHQPSLLSRATNYLMPEHGVSRPEVESVFSEFADVLKASMRPMPITSDGQYHADKQEHSSIWADLKTLGLGDAKTLAETLKQKATGSLIDDKTYVMERIIQLVADLPAGSKTRTSLTNDFVDQLWSSLQHPPLSYLSDQFNYRQPDGSYNNIQFPHLGQGGLPYARSVRPMTQRQGAYPDAGLVFDSVFARYEYKEHPNKVSSVLFYIASIIIHDIFRTDFRDRNISTTSSYLDLAPLYGSTQEEQNGIRTFKDGKLKPDSFSEKRLLGFPPGVGCILVMFNRFHNYVAEQLAAINEHGRFSIRPGLENDPAAIKKRENDLFNVARLVTSGLYINIILTDYLRTIVNLNRTNSTWTLDPRVDMEKAFGDDGTPRGVGNQISVEFNLVYRWHSCISKKDEEWTENLYRKLFPGVDPKKVDWHMLAMGLVGWEKSLPEDPGARTFGEMKRNPDGTFPDDDLVNILKESIEDVAGNFGANNVPIAMKAVEILGIEQARQWKCASLNEFRNFFGLQSHKKFTDINSDPKVAAALERLYDHPDFVELYPGIVAEEAKTPMVPGVGICPTFTISRAILSDAVVLVRGDRFYTVDYTPANLTNWGFSEVACDFSINQGCVFNKLILNAFPKHFKYNSIYAFYPMTVPSETYKIMTDLGRVDDFDYDPPARVPDRIFLNSYGALKTVLNTPQVFKTTWGENFNHMMQGHTWMLSGDSPVQADQRKYMHKAIFQPQDWSQQVFDFYEWITTKLLKDKSYELGGMHMVDAVRDVINIAHTHFAANLFALPLKTAEHPHGIYTEQELYTILSVMFTFVFFDLNLTKSFALHKAAKALCGQMQKLVVANINAINHTGFMKHFMENMEDSKTPMKDFGVHTIRRLLESGKTPDEIAWQVVPASCASVSNQAQVFTQMLNLYLSPGHEQHLQHIQQLATSGTPRDIQLLRKYVLEGARLAGTFGLYRRADVDFQLQDGDKNLYLRKGDTVFINFIAASRDPSAFPDPLNVHLDRPEASYIQYGDGPHQCLGKDINLVALTAMMKCFGKLKNLRRAPGLPGQLKEIPRPMGFKVYMKEDWSAYWPFPTTMKLAFDGGVV